MDIDQFILRLIDQDDRLRSEINSSYSKTILDNIKQRRNLVIQFIAISSAVLAFSIPILDQTTLVKEASLLITSLSFHN